MTSPFRLIVLVALTLAAAPVRGENPFSPVIEINGRVITRYELDQRARFYSVLNAPGDPVKNARDRLIEERLELDAARQAKLTLTPDQIKAGIDEFTGRSQLSTADFIKALAAEGVDEQTLRDFVIAGLLWREVVRNRFSAQVQISDDDIDQALSATAPRNSAVRLLFSEIVLPADTPAAKAESQRRAAEIATYTSVEAFSRAARAFSASPSRDRGGRLDWTNVKDMAPTLVQQLLALAPGQVTQPLPVQNAIVLFQLRQVQDGFAPPPQPLTVDYAIYHIPGGRTAPALARAARIEADADSCNDLYDIARHNPAERVERTSAEMAGVPADIGVALAQLDPGEFSTGLNRGPDLALLMLCSRQIPMPEGVTRDQIRSQLLNQRYETLANGYLAELRADAIIKEP